MLSTLWLTFSRHEYENISQFLAVCESHHCHHTVHSRPQYLILAHAEQLQARHIVRLSDTCSSSHAYVDQYVFKPTAISMTTHFSAVMVFLMSSQHLRTHLLKHSGFPPLPMLLNKGIMSCSSLHFTSNRPISTPRFFSHDKEHTIWFPTSS